MGNTIAHMAEHDDWDEVKRHLSLDLVEQDINAVAGSVRCITHYIVHCLTTLDLVMSSCNGQPFVSWLGKEEWTSFSYFLSVKISM
jgi:hypothetical protein